MATNIDKLLDIISKVATIQQTTISQQPVNTQEPSNVSAVPNKTDPAKYIYIGKEELNAIFPGLGDKLDLTKLLSALLEKFDLSKILGSGQISIKPVEKNIIKQDDTKSEATTEIKDEVKNETKDEIKKEDNV